MRAYFIIEEMHMKRFCRLSVAGLASAVVLTAQTTPAPAPAAPASSTQAPPPVETSSVTKHQIAIEGKTLSYTATAGTLILKKEDGKPSASMFYVAYTLSLIHI